MAIEATLGVDLDQLTLLNHSFVVSTGIEQDLLRLDHNLIQTQFKCGVLCIKDGQSKEEDWFSNENTSNSFTEFLDCLGEKITLKGYHGWAAGLDTKSGDSGEYTIKSKWQDQYEVVYHISTWIPSLGDKQHIQRKRHIGNDVVCIVFVDGHQPFDPAAIKSQFLHVFIVVHQEEWDGDICWRVEVTGIKDVPLFGPPLTKQQMFFDKQSLHDFLLAKVINAEYAATLKSSKFTNLLDRARQGTLMNVVNSALKNHHPIGKQKSFIQPSSFFKDFISDRRRSTQDAFSADYSIGSPSFSMSSSSPTTSTCSSPTDDLIEENMDYLYDQDQYPSPEVFDAIVQDYLQNLSSKKRDKALVDQQRYGLILQVLKDPRNTAISTAQFRFWVKKMFHLHGSTVCHDDKPVAMQEQIYPILIRAHREAHHGGRDKTSALVRKRYSWIPKELIARFVRRCPFCISRRNGHLTRQTIPSKPTRKKRDPIYYYDQPSETISSSDWTQQTTPSSIMAATIATSAAASVVSTQWMQSSFYYYYSQPQHQLISSSSFSEIQKDPMCSTQQLNTFYTDLPYDDQSTKPTSYASSMTSKPMYVLNPDSMDLLSHGPFV
ncbi:uncharacterized protein BX664DRAFT_253874 [Halteromyces radiatus]|uniref:uncharacterized protein n=1 Tax=Halteromyces radiatus TaxID=101107 RepID=UPI00221F0A30|nr:uncharacterized protein BX664DRAFT_253874 [Halteromyces radiatus]KAI8099312.1 hypothetical protein BX664DRAFT_253874 [Halteromyces radiatus]